jgi:CDGSH-type Zn-finger protein/truncated hemoglobin YjbI
VSGTRSDHNAQVDKVVDLLQQAVDLAADASDSPADRSSLIAERLDKTVIRPLVSWVGRPAPPPKAGRTAPLDDLERRVRALAEALIEAATPATGPADLIEAIAGLQYLVATAPDAVEGLPAPKADAVWPTEILRLRVQTDGPYLVSGDVDLRTWLGEDLSALMPIALCRCGRSESKPFCDGTHAELQFSGEKDPRRVADRRDRYDGQRITMFDNRGICAHSGFCTNRVPNAFRTDQEPFIAASGARFDDLVKAAQQCPSGALSFALAGREESRDDVDTDRPPAIEVSRDGPYRVTGQIPLVDADGTGVPRNQGVSLEHYSLCRCGQSQNKPFCSGMHYYVSFRDPAPDRDQEPTLFEWAGGFPALLRMTRTFYEKYVPEDPLIGPLFASMAPDHPERVASWLSQVFGGPAWYSERYGGYQRMISQHTDKRLTEEQRARWVALLRRSAADAGLPDDAEFAAAFSSYLEWGSRIAVENSQPDARPPQGMPVPKWSWASGAIPGTRVSALEPEEPASPAATLPAPDEPVVFNEHIKPLFRDRDRQSMKFAFDLWDFADVTANSDAILDRLRRGTMPCDGAWPSEKVDVFQRWVESGMPQSAGSIGLETTDGSTKSAAAQSDAGPAAAVTDDQPIGGGLGRSVALRSATTVEERPLVIEHREPLIYMLCAAAELEHALMCEYLFAAFSLKTSVDEGLTVEQLAAVERWRAAILMVAKQEMLHLAINSNLISSLGASPHLSRPNLPQPARHYPPGVRLTLLPFGEQALRHFLFLERPEGMDIGDAEGLSAVDGAVPVLGEEEIAPHLQEFATVGHLYRSIEAGFRHLAAKWGEERLFMGPVDSQARGELFGWPQLEPISTVDGAVRAIEAIVEQGEGPRGHWRSAHFGRFLNILNEYLDMLAADPGVQVARPVLPALVRQPESGEEVDLITDPRTARIAELGNVAYEVLLQMLYRLLCHVDETDQQIHTLSKVSVGLMFDAIEPLGEILTSLPVGPNHPDRTAGPTFELFYQPDYLLPHLRAAWVLMAEHLEEAADLCERDQADVPELEPVGQAMRRHAATLRRESETK